MGSDVMSVDVPISVDVVPMSVDAGSVVEVSMVVSVVAGDSSTVSSFLHPANGISRKINRHRSER
jgi:hypothetical protein